MSSSISSSEIRVLAAVALAFGAVELGLRAIEDKLSVDVKHIRAIPSIVAGLGNQPAPRAIFLGNSLTRASIRTKAIAEAWPDGPHMARIHPDDTTLLDWHYVYRRYLSESKPRPNLIVVGFAAGQLDDGQTLHVDRLGSHFAGLRFAREAFDHDLPATGDRVEFVLAATFRAMAYRERVQTRLLAAVPGYRQLANAINRGVKPKSGKKPAKVGFRRLRRFLQAARDNGDRIVFVAVPLPGTYAIREELHAAIRDGGSELIDMQGVASLDPSDFPDGYHLAEPAAERFSRALGSVLSSNAFVRQALVR